MIDDEELSLSISTTSSRREPPRTQQPKPEPSRSSNLEHQRTEIVQKVRLGQYDIIKTLGEGSFGKVKLATHHSTGQKVALKIINRKKLKTRDMAGRIEREIQYLQLLRHPHIIKLYDHLNHIASSG
jgi:carbon catabolite-derepressing protein kinase